MALNQSRQTLETTILDPYRYHLWRIVSENVYIGDKSATLRLVDEMTIFIPNLEDKKTSWKVQLAKVSRYSCRHLQGGDWRTPEIASSALTRVETDRNK